jgi:two-component system NarL family sensor kinase
LEDKTPIEIPVLIVITTIGILVFIFFVVLFVLFYQKKELKNKVLREEKEKNHQRALLNATIEIAEAERKKIADNLHDDIGTIINLVKLNIGKIEKSTADKSVIKELSNESSGLLETTMENIRNISRDLAPPVLIQLGFEEGLKDLCQKISHSGTAKIVLTKSDGILKLSPKTELQVYRIIQEVINNVLKHASATEISIILNALSDKMVVTLFHNGDGISNESIDELTKGSKGLGLKSIKSRAQVIGATVNYSSTNSLSSILIETPLNEKNI